MYVIFTIPWGQITQFCKNNTQPKSSSFSRSGTFPAKFPYSIYTCFGGSTALMISAIHEKKMLRTTHAATLRFLLCAILIFPIRQMIQMIAPTIVVIITVLLLCLFGLCVHRSLKLNAVYSFWCSHYIHYTVLCQFLCSVKSFCQSFIENLNDLHMGTCFPIDTDNGLFPVKLKILILRHIRWSTPAVHDCNPLFQFQHFL